MADRKCLPRSPSPSTPNRRTVRQVESQVPNVQDLPSPSPAKHGPSLRGDAGVGTGQIRFNTHPHLHSSSSQELTSNQVQAELARLDGMVANVAFSREELFARLSGPRSDSGASAAFPKTERWTRSITGGSTRAIPSPGVSRCSRGSAGRSPRWSTRRRRRRADPFEAAWDRFGNCVSPPRRPSSGAGEGPLHMGICERVDEQCGIGTFGMIFLGIDDGLLLQTPVAGSPPDGRPKDMTGVAGLGRPGRNRS